MLPRVDPPGWKSLGTWAAGTPPALSCTSTSARRPSPRAASLTTGLGRRRPPAHAAVDRVAGEVEDRLGDLPRPGAHRQLLAALDDEADAGAPRDGPEGAAEAIEQRPHRDVPRRLPPFPPQPLEERGGGLPARDGVLEHQAEAPVLRGRVHAREPVRRGRAQGREHVPVFVRSAESEHARRDEAVLGLQRPLGVEQARGGLAAEPPVDGQAVRVPRARERGEVPLLRQHGADAEDERREQPVREPPAPAERELRGAGGGPRGAREEEQEIHRLAGLPPQEPREAEREEAEQAEGAGGKPGGADRARGQDRGRRERRGEIRSRRRAPRAGAGPVVDREEEIARGGQDDRRDGSVHRAAARGEQAHSEGGEQQGEPGGLAPGARVADPCERHGRFGEGECEEGDVKGVPDVRHRPSEV